MNIFQGDLKPDLTITLSDTSGDAVDVTTADAVRIIGTRAGAILFDRAPTTTEVVGLTSVLTMEWETADTAAAGTIAIEVEVTWPTAKPQTFRPPTAVTVIADADA